jgi:hypothetical protein
VHQAENIQGDGATLVSGLVAEAAVHGAGDLLQRKRALIQGWAAAEGFVAALVMATGAACEENLFTRDELASGWGGLL